MGHTIKNSAGVLLENTGNTMFSFPHVDLGKGSYLFTVSDVARQIIFFKGCTEGSESV